MYHSTVVVCMCMCGGGGGEGVRKFLLVLEYQGSHNKHRLFKGRCVCVYFCVIVYECIIAMVLSVV